MADATAAPDTRSAPPSANSNKPIPKSTVILSMPEDTLHVPYGPPIIVGGIMVAGAILANLWQPFTTVLAFAEKIGSSPIYAKMNIQGFFGSLPSIAIICLIIAIPAQLGLLNFVFQVDEKWSRNAQGVGVGDNIKHTAVELKNQSGLMLVWTGLAVLVDTAGDATFIGFYTKDGFIMLMYMCFLYAASTVMLTAGVHKLHAGMISWEKWKAWKNALNGGPTGGSGAKPGPSTVR